MEKIREKIIFIAPILPLILLIMLFSNTFSISDYLWYNSGFDRVEEFICTFSEIYPELKPISFELLLKDKITWRDKQRFSRAIDEIQEIYKHKRIEEGKRKLKEEYLKGVN